MLLFDRVRAAEYGMSHSLREAEAADFRTAKRWQLVLQRWQRSIKDLSVVRLAPTGHPGRAWIWLRMTEAHRGNYV
jgi:hypothetical protein